MGLGIFAGKDANGGRHGIEYGLQSGGEAGRRTRAFDPAHAFDGEAIPVGRRCLVARVEEADDSVELAKRGQVAQAGIGQRARGFVAGLRQIAGDGEGGIVKTRLAVVHQQAERDPLGVRVHEPM